MSVTWIMVANASQAKLFANRGPRKGLELVKELLHPESRIKTSNLVSDRSGSGPGHGSFIQATDPKHHEAEIFAHEISRALEVGRVNNAYDRLILVASKPFMGLINQRLPGQVRNMLSQSIDKDYTRLPPRDLVDQLEGVVSL
jgi:protein required for attachment to host cells